MPKHRLTQNVYECAMDRVRFTLDNFERVYLSFSAGKDSTVMLHLTMQEVKKRGMKIGILIVDLEGQYKLTIDHLKACIDEYADNIELFVRRYRGENVVRAHPGAELGPVLGDRIGPQLLGHGTIEEG